MSNHIYSNLRKEYKNKTGKETLKHGEFTANYVQYLEEWIHKARSLNLVSIDELREDVERLKETGHLFNGVQFEYVNVEDLNDLFKAILSQKETVISVNEQCPCEILDIPKDKCSCTLNNRQEIHFEHIQKLQYQITEIKYRQDEIHEVVSNVVFDHIQDLQTENAEMKERIRKLENKLSESKYCRCETPNYYMDRRCVKCRKYKEQYAKQAGR